MREKTTSRTQKGDRYPFQDMECLSRELAIMLNNPCERTYDRLRIAAWLCKRAKRGFSGYKKADEK